MMGFFLHRYGITSGPLSFRGAPAPVQKPRPGCAEFPRLQGRRLVNMTSKTHCKITTLLSRGRTLNINSGAGGIWDCVHELLIMESKAIK